MKIDNLHWNFQQSQEIVSQFLVRTFQLQGGFEKYE